MSKLEPRTRNRRTRLRTDVDTIDRRVTFLARIYFSTWNSKGSTRRPNGWQKTAAYRLLSETKLGALLEDLAIQAIEVYQETAPTKVRIKGVDAVDVLKQVARHGFAFAVFGKPPERSRYVSVLLAKATSRSSRPCFRRWRQSRGGEVDEKG